MSGTNELRVLVLVERADADAVFAISSDSGIVAEGCLNIDDLCSGIAAGAGAAVIGQEALPRASFDKLAATLRNQPAWSDFPVLLIALPTGGWKDVEDILAPSADHGNFVVVQRPLSTEILVTALRAALRARTRQYELRRAHEQGTFPPPVLPGLHGRMASSDTQTGRRPPPAPGCSPAPKSPSREIALQDEVQRLQTRVAELEREQQIRATIIDQSPVMISVVRAPDFVYEFVNPAFQTLAPGKEFIGRRFADVWAEVSDRLVEILQSVIETGETFRLKDSPYTIERGPGAPPEVVYVTYSWIPLAGPDGKPDRILTLAHETTALVRQLQAEAAVRESEERFRSLTENMSEGLMLFDAQGNFIYQNPASLRIHGFGTSQTGHVESGNLPAEWKGWDETGRPLPFEEWPLSRVLRGERFQNQILHATKPGTEQEFYASYNGCPIVDANGKQKFGFITVREISEQRKAEMALRESRDLLAQIARAGSFDLDLASNVVVWSEELQELYGIGLGESIVNMEDWVRSVLPEDRERVMGDFTAGLTAGEVTTQFRIHRRDTGEVRWIEWRGRVVRDEKGAPVRVIGFSIEITEQKRAEQALRESEARFRALTAASSEVQYCMSPDWSEMRQLSGGRFLADTKGPDRTWLQRYIPPDEQSRVMATINEAIRTKSTFELEHRVRRLDGSLGWTFSRAIPMLNEDGEITEWFGAASDITERKRAEEALRVNEERLHTALDAADLGAWDYRLDTGEVVWDERSERIFGAAGKHRLEYADAIARIHPDDRPGSDEAFKRAIAGANGGAYHREFRVVWPDGSVHWVAGHGRVFFEEGDGAQPRAVRFAGVNMDVTDRKAAEERLRHAQKLESIGLLAGGIAHDFNNLLTVIMGAASSALDECPSCDSSKVIVSAAERAAHLTKQLLAYAGKGQFIKKTVDISDLVSRSRELLAVSVPKRINLVFNLAKNLPAVEEDPSRIDQILMNLVINAGEAIAPKTDGRLEVKTGMAEVTEEATRLHSRFEVAPGVYVWLEVRDNGAGMDEATLSRIFDPYFSTKFTGRGLGLAAVDGIVRSSKGFIDVQSSPNLGSTFRVYLPASDNKRPAEVDAPGQRSAFRSVSTVLVVEDEEMVRKLASMILRRHGYEVLEANDGKHALQVLAESPSLPSLLLLDLAMPVMGGDELVPILAAQYPALKMIISSGYPEEEARRNFPITSVAGFLQKPYAAVTLTGKVDEILGGTPSRQPGQIIQFPNLETG